MYNYELIILYAFRTHGSPLLIRCPYSSADQIGNQYEVAGYHAWLCMTCLAYAYGQATLSGCLIMPPPHMCRIKREDDCSLPAYYTSALEESNRDPKDLSAFHLEWVAYTVKIRTSNHIIILPNTTAACTLITNK